MTRCRLWRSSPCCRARARTYGVGGVARQHQASALLTLNIVLHSDLPTLWITPYLYLHIASYLVRRVRYFG